MEGDQICSVAKRVFYYNIVALGQSSARHRGETSGVVSGALTPTRGRAPASRFPALTACATAGSRHAQPAGSQSAHAGSIEHRKILRRIQLTKFRQVSPRLEHGGRRHLVCSALATMRHAWRGTNCSAKKPFETPKKSKMWKFLFLGV